MVTDPAMGGMGHPLINVAHWLILHEIQRIYQKKPQERQVLGTQKRAGQLSLARRGQRHSGRATRLFVENPSREHVYESRKKGI